MSIRCLVLVLLFFAPSLADEHGAHRQRPYTDAEAAAGKALYLSECSSCHGERGNGDGPAADFVDPHPRDFTSGRFKLRTTESGHPPASSDILRTIDRGMPGTAMPSFAFLPEDERKKITAYVLKLADLLNGPEPEPIQDPGTPPATTAALLAKGKQIYTDAGCATCHGPLGKGDGTSAKYLKDANGHPIKPRDFTAGIYRGGGTPRDIYYRIATGIDGTPMPAYKDSIDPPDVWAVTAYVLSLRAPAAPQPRPTDPILAGREVAAKYNCQACHVLDDGKGGDVGPDLRAAAQKLGPDRVRTFLKAPRVQRDISTSRIYRMPQLGLTDDEIEVMTKYVAAIGKQQHAPCPSPVAPPPKL
jgi:mono/diheme cytochrome c family protein